jgi:general secretion pathway protein D
MQPSPHPANQSIPDVHSWSIRVVIFSMGMLLAIGAPLSAQGQTIPVNQKRMRIEQLVERVGEATGRTILVPDDVRGTISIVAKRQVTHEEAWSILESSLSILGFTILPSTVGNWRISKVATAVGEAPFRLNAGSDSESYVTTLIPLRSANMRDILKVLEPLSGSRVTLVPFDRTNSLIASRSERAIARLTEIADELDKIEEEVLRLRVLRYRDVGEVEPFVESFLESQGVAARGLQVWSDQRTNSIVIRGNEEAVERVFSFLGSIDRPVEGGGSIRILRVLHREAEEVAELIRGLGESASAEGSETSSATLSGMDFSIAVDERSRSLVVRADPQTHEVIRELLETLDQRAELIAVDVTISEIRTPETFGLSFAFTIPFAAGNNPGDVLGIINTGPGLEASGVEPSLFGRVTRDTGVSFDVPGVGGPVTVPILQTGTFAAVDFEATNEVLIQPSLVVTAGDQHEIFVGDNVPIPVTEENAPSDATIGGVPLDLLSVTTQFDRRDVGTRLAIDATAGREGKIQLDLEIELSAIDPTRAGLAGDPTVVGPTYLEQLLTVTARLDDGETAVLAVDRSQVATEFNSGVPFLRDLPMLGWLFRSNAEVIEDLRLVIAVRARRVSNPSELVADTIRRRLAFERRDAREVSLPNFGGEPYGVRVTTRRREDDADAIADALAMQGLQTRTHRWESGEKEYFDVYVIQLNSIVDAAEIAEDLSNDGWEADIVVFTTKS